MAYRFAVTRENHAELAPGAVLHSAPGFPAFPVRLASEMFRRAAAARSSSPLTVWDPCCGSGYLLTVVALRHRRDVARVIGTDIDPAALDLARRNLALLSRQGLTARSSTLRERGDLFDKPAYSVAAVAALQLARALAARGGDVPHAAAQADVFDPAQLRRALDGERPGLVLTDVPYGEQTVWGGAHAGTGVAGMLRAVSAVLDDDAVLAVATRGRSVVGRGEVRPLDALRVGTRAVALFRAGQWRP